MSAPHDTDRYQAWLESTITDKLAEVVQLKGEIGAYQNALTVLRRVIAETPREKAK